jgi:glycosyltransferase involved in cell wall biosynthesis
VTSSPAATAGAGEARPTVSVLVLAYNVERYVSQALDGVLAQEGDFSYEIVVGEDRSTDGTRAILTDYAARHPGKFRLILRPENLGMNRNFYRTLAECRGTYVALLDGDDYWTSPHKLRKQVEFLESRREYSMCFHNVTVAYEDGGTEPHPFHLPERTRRLSRTVPRPTTTLDDIVRGNFIQTCSAVFRAGLFGEVPAWCPAMPTYDWPLHILNAQHGPIGYIDEVLATYRVHEGGMWSDRMSRYEEADDVQRMIEAYRTVDQYLEGRYHRVLEEQVMPLQLKAARLLYAARRRREANRHAAGYLRAALRRKKLPPRALFGWAARAYLPGREALAGRRVHAPDRGRAG